MSVNNNLTLPATKLLKPSHCGVNERYRKVVIMGNTAIKPTKCGTKKGGRKGRGK